MPGRPDFTPLYPSRISGEVVKISGTAVQISGQTVFTMSGSTTYVSGQWVVAKVSGEFINISGSVVSISGQSVSVSGQPISISGQLVKVSGQAVRVSGQLVKISGESVVISGQQVRVSGELVKVSGQAVRVSGQLVKISGESVVISGQLVKVSGQAVRVSGQLVKISGESVFLGSGLVKQPHIDEYGKLKTGVVEYAKMVAQEVSNVTIEGTESYGGILAYPDALGANDEGVDKTTGGPTTSLSTVVDKRFVSVLNNPMDIVGTYRGRVRVGAYALSGAVVTVESIVIDAEIDDGTSISSVIQTSIGGMASPLLTLGESTSGVIRQPFFMTSGNVIHKVGAANRLVERVRVYAAISGSTGMSGYVELVHTRGNDMTHLQIPVIR